MPFFQQPPIQFDIQHITCQLKRKEIKLWKHCIKNKLQDFRKYRWWPLLLQYTVLKLIRIGMCVKLDLVSYGAKKMSLSYKVHEKIADQPCYNVIFYMRRTEHKYWKRICLCLQLIKKCCQCRYFLDFIYWALVFTTKKSF